MAKIVYYANLDYDCLPTSKKRRISAPLSETYSPNTSFNQLHVNDQSNNYQSNNYQSNYCQSNNYQSTQTFNGPAKTNYSNSTPPEVSTPRANYQYSTPSQESTTSGHQSAVSQASNTSNYHHSSESQDSWKNKKHANKPRASEQPRSDSCGFQPASSYDSNSSYSTPSGFYHTNNHTPNTTKYDSKTLHLTLKKYFHFDSFRENQLEAVEATCAGLDTLILMPTGGGKSICYQLPAILSDGVSIVVSPLKSLIADQVLRLKSLHIETSAMFGDTAQDEIDEVKRDLESSRPRHKLLYVTPEKISASASLMKLFRSLYSRNLLSRFVIDEAHCVSMWGSDFRPDYRKLGILRQEFPAVPVMALTATAPQKVRDDILNQLGMNKSTGRTFIQSFNRPNLKFEVRPKTGKNCHFEICKLIRANFRGQCGIIYCFSRAECETVAEKLREEGITSAPYHAGLSDTSRTKVFSNWSKGFFQVVCATIAFGMGIDKSDVRFVIHYSLPKSVEGYYQEAGRAGRDGKFASCILFYSRADCVKMKRMLSKTGFGRKVTDKNRDTGNFQHMIDYCEKNECRRSILLRYLGEDFNRRECMKNITTACDNCLASRNQ